MKKLIALALFAVVALSIKAQHITDFCYFDGQLLETYSDVEVVNNLKILMKKIKIRGRYVKLFL